MSARRLSASYDHSWLQELGGAIVGSDPRPLMPRVASTVTRSFTQRVSQPDDQPRLTVMALISTRSPPGAVPDLSPDGSRIVFVDHGALATMNSDGKRRWFRWLGASRVVSTSPKWSPDGTQIAFTDCDNGGGPTVGRDPSRGRSPSKRSPHASSPFVVPGRKVHRLRPRKLHSISRSSLPAPAEPRYPFRTLAALKRVTSRRWIGHPTGTHIVFASVVVNGHPSHHRLHGTFWESFSSPTEPD